MRPSQSLWTAVALTAVVVLSAPAVARAQMQDRLCDTELEDCRAPLLNLIRNETQGIDVAFWYMADARYSYEIIKKFQAGVPVRVLMDDRADASKPTNTPVVQQLKDAGIPMRKKNGGGILHWKMMLFHGQNVVEFSKANFSSEQFVAIQPGVNWDDEAVFFTRDDRLTNTFRTKFDNLWIDTVNYANYANITSPLVRSYPIFPLDASLNLPPGQDFADRSVARYNLEQQGIDVLVFRATDSRHADAMIAAVKRGVPVRLIHDPQQYRDPKYWQDAYNVDRMYMNGVTIKHRAHQGLTHEAAVIMHGLGEVIFGSSNWSVASANSQLEHNYFYRPAINKVLDSGETFYQWFVDQFNRKWSNTSGFVPFQPLPPANPVYSAPANGTTGVTAGVTLTWDGGEWAHRYDIYFGTTPTPPLMAADVVVGSPDTGTMEAFIVSNLAPSTTYYWRIVGKTMANMTKSGPTWSFTTSNVSVGPSTPFTGTPLALPGTIQVEDFDNGGSGIAYGDTTAGNSGNVYRSTNVDIGTASDTGGGYYVGWTRPSEWMNYTVNVASTGTYTLDVRVANVGTGASFRVEVDGVDRTGAIAVPNTGGWQTWKTISRTGISLSAGTRRLRLVFLSPNTQNTGVGNFNHLTLRQTSSSGGQATPYSGTPTPLPGILEVEKFDNGGTGVAYVDSTVGNLGGAYRTTDDVDIGATSDTGGGYYVGWTTAGEWLQYTVNVTQTGNYTLETRIASRGTGARFHVEVDGTDVTGPMSVPDTGGWQTWQTVTKAGISLTAGTRAVRLVLDQGTASNGGVGNYNYLRFTQASASTGGTPFGGTPALLPGLLEIENFDSGGTNITYFDTTAGNSGGAYRNTSVDIGPTTDSGGGYYVGWTRASEWLKYTVNVTQSGTYTLDIRIASRGTGASFHVEVDGVNVTGPVTVPDTGGWQTWQTVSKAAIPLSAGTRELRLVFDQGTIESSGVGNYNYLRFR